METFTVNFTGQVRRETFDGRAFLVAPMTLLIGNSVMNGSKGPLLYPREECARAPGMWNHIPITDGHPVDQSGNPVSARSPKILSKYQLGYVFNDHWNGKARVAEGWFDVEMTRNKSPEIYRTLSANKSMDLSTGLFTHNHVAANGSVANGRAYTHVARDLVADHLAVLSNGQTGACSRRDGCGVLVGNRVDDFDWDSLREDLLFLNREMRMNNEPDPDDVLPVGYSEGPHKQPCGCKRDPFVQTIENMLRGNSSIEPDPDDVLEPYCRG